MILPRRLGGRSEVGREADEVSVVGSNEVVPAVLGGQRRHGLAVRPHAVQVVVAVERVEVLVLALLPLALQAVIPFRRSNREARRRDQLRIREMLDEVGDKKNIPEFIKRAKDKEDPFRLMGFGHRVYRNFDPRAGVLKKACDEVLDDLGIHDPRLELAMELERIALEDEYFVDRKLFPNVDFYSGIILKAMGFPTEMFTVLFAVARTVGWVSQWKEMMEEPSLRIGRPRQLYTGPEKRPYIPIDKRK